MTATEKPYSKNQISKIGNTLIYLANKIPLLAKTKALKLLFILEEASIKKYGIPFNNIDFQVWRLGPVSKDIFVDLSSGSPNILSQFVSTNENVSIGGTVITAINTFNDDEFSDNDIELMDIIINAHGDKSADQLINLTHSQSGLWFKKAKENDLLSPFDNGNKTASDIFIDFEDLFSEDSDALKFYRESKEFLKQSSFFKSQDV